MKIKDMLMPEENNEIEPLVDKPATLTDLITGLGDFDLHDLKNAGWGDLRNLRESASVLCARIDRILNLRTQRKI